MILFYLFSRSTDTLYDGSAATFYMNEIKVITKVIDLKKHMKQLITQVVCVSLKFWQDGIQPFPGSLAALKPMICDRGNVFWS